VNPHYLAYLRNFAEGKPYMDVRQVDLTNAAHFAPLAEQYDTVVCLNVLEHVDDEAAALRNVFGALTPGGRAVILVPQDPQLFGTLDEVLCHKRRYTRESFRAVLEANGFRVEELFDFNRVTTPAWWFNGRVLKRQHFGRVQLKMVNLLTAIFRALDAVAPWAGASLIAVARRVSD
jgi:SAM-dependent methyltransferase